MQITTEKLEENQILLNVQVEEEVVEKSMDQAYRRVVQRTNIPGFRRGKAPRAMVERFVGRTALLEEALEKLLPELCRQALEEQGIQALGQPRLEVVQVDPVIFKAVVPLPPTVELSDYRQIRATLKEVQVSEEQVDSFLEDLRREAAPWEPSLGSAKMGDLVTLDLQAQEGGVGVLGREGVPFLMSEGISEPAPGLAPHLLGVAKGDKADFNISYPGDYPNETWAGRHIDFQAHVKEIKEKRLPPLDDEFAKGVGDGYESLEALRQQIRSRILEGAQRQAQEELEEQVVQAVVAGASVEFPPLLTQAEVEALLSDLKRRMEGQGLTMAQYLKFTNKSEEGLREELVPRAKERVKRRLVLDKVAEAEGLEVASEEVEAEIEKAVQDTGPRGAEVREALDTPGGRASIEGVLRTRRTLARLVELATSPEPEPQSPEQEAAPQEEGA